MGVREALLALLADGPRHGYQLKVEFERDTGAVWPINVGQVYTTLQRLERDGLVVAGTEDADGRIAYALTEDGRAEVVSWYATPVDRTAPSRDEVTMKLLLAIAGHGSVEAEAVVAVQRAATMTALQDYTRLKADADRDEPAWTLQLERLVMIAEAELRWLDRVEDRLELLPARRSSPGALDTDDDRTVARPSTGETA